MNRDPGRPAPVDSGPPPPRKSYLDILLCPNRYGSGGPVTCGCRRWVPMRPSSHFDPWGPDYRSQPGGKILTKFQKSLVWFYVLYMETNLKVIKKHLRKNDLTDRGLTGIAHPTAYKRGGSKKLDQRYRYRFEAGFKCNSLAFAKNLVSINSTLEWIDRFR